MTGDTWDLVVSSIGPLLSGTVRGTIPLTLVSFAIGLVLALLVALARLSRRPPTAPSAPRGSRRG